MRLLRLVPITVTGLGLSLGIAVEAAPGKPWKRESYDGDDASPSPGTVFTKPPYGYDYNIAASASKTTDPSSQTWGSHVSKYLPTCADWVLCYSCPGGYYCPSSLSEASPTPSSLVILPTCESWKACPECRGAYKCWKLKPTSTEFSVETTSSLLTINPTCYPWTYCYTCIGGYTCSNAPAASTTTVPDAVAYPTCSNYVLCPTCEEGYLCPSVSKGSGVSRHTEYLPTCSDFQPCATCDWGWRCPAPTPTKTYTMVITKGTLYTTVTEIIPGGYYGYSTGRPAVLSQGTSTYNWASYDQPTCADYVVCPTCDIGYYCPNSQPGATPPTPIYYLPPTSTTSPFPSFYPPPPCDNYVACPACFLGYYCPTLSTGAISSTKSKEPIKSYGVPRCDDYIVCPTCPLGYYCPDNTTTQSPSATLYYSPLSAASPRNSGYGSTNSNVAETKTTSVYNWAAYEQPTCSDYIFCPTCPSGYYCPPSTALTRASTPRPYGFPTCTDYIVCPTCDLGYYCPPAPKTTSIPKYYTPQPSQAPSTSRNAYLPPTTYYIGLPTTTLVVAPTCSEYVLCPVCPSGYYCPSSSPLATPTKDAGYYYPTPTSLESPTSTIPPCDVYVFCPECDLGYSCLITYTSSASSLGEYGSYSTVGTANPQLSNPYFGYGSQIPSSNIGSAYVTNSANTGYESATVPAPAVPTCAGYILCPTCPLGYYCVATAEPSFAYSTKYGTVPTGIVESVYSTAIIPPSYTPQSLCPGPKTVTVTKTRDVFHIYNTCGIDPYAILSSFTIPTVTITQCNPTNPVVPPYVPSTFISTSNTNFYTLPRPTDFSPLSLTNWGQGRPYSQGTPSPIPQTTTSCSFKPCDGGYYCETCPHKWYCPTPADSEPSNILYP
ncbi:hypothetical protein H072_2175 [Dactylellina haptotyla CBS 200.50]|uniref:Uncharacterized protein n=1 Tax=Dactylellina haptotyla (strain CBS 200.50) TaxID=1284197 RepID=S8AM25_DACHA|nr:hypothetical protein H072_2175 [Dactylellina haptotyla CBS 200.50]